MPGHHKSWPWRPKEKEGREEEGGEREKKKGPLLDKSTLTFSLLFLLLKVRLLLLHAFGSWNTWSTLRLQHNGWKSLKEVSKVSKIFEFSRKSCCNTKMIKKIDLNAISKNNNGWTRIMKTCINGKKLKMRHFWEIFKHFFTAYSCQNWIHKQYVSIDDEKCSGIVTTSAYI